MKKLPKVMSNVFGASGGMSRYSPTFNISMKEWKWQLKWEIKLE